MLYFIILPIWLAAVAGMTAVAVATRFVPRFRPAYPFAWRILLWTSVGFLAANGLVMVFYVVAGRLAAIAGPPPHHAVVEIGGAAVAAGLLLAPIAGTGCGFLGGLALAVWLAIRATR